MSVTSANLDDLQTFIRGSDNRSGRLESSYSTASTKSSAVMANSSFQHPDTPSLRALHQLLDTWRENGRFVQTIRDELVAADQYDADGQAVVANTAIDAALQAKGLTDAPGVVGVDAVQLYGTPPYSGWVDDPISLATGNFLLRDGDIELFGAAAVLSVVRAYNSRDRRRGAFGPGWSALVDVGLAVEDRQVTFRGADGGGAVFRRLDDGSWTVDRRRDLSLHPSGSGWEVRQGHERSWRFDAEGALVGLTGGGADVTVSRRPEQVRFDDRTSGRWVTYQLDPRHGSAVAVETSDGRTSSYRYDERGHLVAVARDRGGATYEVDEAGFLLAVVDADGVVVCRNTYDDEGRVLRQVEHHGRETSYEYRADGVATVTASDGAPPNVMVHDRRGRMTAMIDGLGNTMRIAYDDADDIVQVVDRTGAVTRYAHDERGNLVEQVDPDGLVRRWEHDELDRVVAEVDRAGGTTRYVYEGDRRSPSRIVQPDGAEVVCTYGELELPTTVVDADGVVTTLEWNRDGLLTALVDGLGDRLEFAYDAAGRTVGVAAPDVWATVDLDPAGRVRTVRTVDGEQRFEHSAAGRVTGGVDPRGRRWRAMLDHAGDVVELVDDQGALLRYERDLVGQVTAVVAADGGRTSFEHDPVGRRTAVIEPEGGQTSIDHDPEGRALVVTDASGRTWSRELDVLGRTTVVVEPGGGTSIRDHHPNGQLASVTDAAGNEWRYEVDAAGRVVRAVDPLGGTTTYRYTPGGRLAEVTTPAGRQERREYDAAGRLARIVEPDGTEVVFERAPGGAVRRVLRDGVPTLAYESDGRGRPSHVVGPWGELSGVRVAGDLTTLTSRGTTATFEHDPRGLLQRVVDPAGVVTEFVHDACGRLVAATTDVASTTYEWDRAGRVRSVTDPHGHRTRFERDARGTVERVIRADGGAVRWAFDADGNLEAAFGADGEPLVRVARDATGAVVGATADGAELELTRDALQRIVAVRTDAGTVRYRRDADGAVLAVADDVAGELTIERRDGGRVTGFTVPDGRAVGLPAPVPLERDEHQRIVVDEHGRRYAYDHAGRLVEATVAGATTTYTYDDRGLLATERGPKGARSYRYGPGGEPVSLVREDGVDVSFEHDANGNRIREVASDGTTTTYGWDALGRLTSVHRVEPDGTEVTHHISLDPVGRPCHVDGTPILWDGGGTGSLHGIGDERYLWWGNQVLVATDPNATWSRRVSDDPWGDDGGEGLRLGYRGELALDGLLLLGRRAYDTRTRSFLSPDPLPSTPGALTYAGVYSYAWCDPVNLVDPSGMKPVSDEDYAAWKEQNTKGAFRMAYEAVKEDPWRWAAKGLVVIAGAAVMIGATAVLGPGGLIIAGAVVGGLTAGINAKIDGKSWGDAGRSALLGAAFGAATVGLSRYLPIPASTATNPVVRVGSNMARNIPTEYGMATVGELADSKLPGGDGRMDWDNVALDGTMGTLSSGISPEVARGVETGLDHAGERMFGDTIDGALRDALRGETGSTLLPDPARDTVFDLNSAGAGDLQRIHGIGDTLSQRIVEHRPPGGYTSTDQLLDVPGIGPSRLEAIIGAGVTVE